MAGRFWKVIGGGDKGGILVRTGKQVSSPEATSRLSTGALVKELEVAEGRLSYQLVSGEGPETGWVTIKLKDKALLEEAAAPARKLRVLCLHGTAGSPGVLKAQLKTLLEVAEDKVDFIFHAGHLTCEEDDPICGSDVKLLKPFFPGETLCQYALPTGGVDGKPRDGDAAKPETWRSYDKLSDALERLQEALKQHAPIDAVLGFSQGSNLASLLVAQAAMGQGASFRCVVHMCSSLPGWKRDLPELFPAPLPIPALVIRGEQDTAVSGFDEIVKLYDVQVVQTGQHSADHRPLPKDPKESAQMSEEILNFLLQHCRIDQDFRFCWGAWTQNLAAGRCKAEWGNQLPPFTPVGPEVFYGEEPQPWRKELPGRIYKMEFPHTPELLESKKYGAEWLTRAFHAAGTLPKDNAVKRLFNVKPVIGGGACEKARFEVEYEKPAAYLHTKLFMKYPWNIGKDKTLFTDRVNQSLRMQGGEYYEIDAYRLMESSLPFSMPKFYFGDVNNTTTNWILITELIPFGPKDKPLKDFKPLEVEPAYNKFIDNEQFEKPIEYYRLMIKANAKMAGWYKSGRMGDKEMLDKNFSDGTKFYPQPIPEAEFKTKLKTCEEFIRNMDQFFPPGAVNDASIKEWKRVMHIVNLYRAEIAYRAMMNEDYNAIAHGNMNVDNTWYWRDAKKELHIGVLDWGGLGKLSLPQRAMWWSLYACELELFEGHLDELLQLFVDTYESEGGPKLDVEVLRRDFFFAALDQMLDLPGAVPLIYKFIKKPVWVKKEIKDRHDSRLRDDFLTRMYVLGIVLIFRMISTYDLGKLCDEFLAIPGLEKKKIPNL